MNKIKNIIKKYLIFTKPGLKILKYNGYDSNDLKLIKSNRKFLNIHKGERCFILGNGPSVLTEDLSPLKNEMVFVVNQASKAKYYKKVRPDYYFCVDEVFFKLDSSVEQENQVIESFKNLKFDNYSPECFIPSKFREVIRDKYRLSNLNINYFVETFRMTDDWKSFIDYSKVVPAFGTVVQYCITMAVYMGFKEIYLMGCDNTGILVTINSLLNENNEHLYSYKVSENEKQRMENMVKKNGLEAYCESYLYTLQDYRKLFNYCKKFEVKLVNCSSKTVIDSLPRMNMVDLFNKRYV